MTLDHFVRWMYALKGLWAVVAALIVGAFLVVLAGANPLEAYAALLRGGLFDYVPSCWSVSR